jgi:hypothetical protein
MSGRFAGRGCVGAVMALVAVALAGRAGAAEPSLPWVDATAAWGLAEPLKGIMAHEAACGDIAGDGRVCPATTSPDELFGEDRHARDRNAADWAWRRGSRGVRRQGLPTLAATS